MYTYQTKTHPDFQLDIEINIPKKTITDQYQQSFENLRKDLVIEGFRKGMAPKEIAKKKINKEKVYQQLIQTLLPKIYQEIIQKEKLRPIINPQIDFKKVQENEDWQIIIKIAIKPEINLKNYKKLISDLNKNRKKPDLWALGQSSEKQQKDKEKEKVMVKDINEVFNLLLKEVDCPIANIIVEEELNRKLSSLIDELQKVGLTIETYLKSKNLTLDQLKESYKKEIQDTYRLEFILQEIADKENIIVEEKEINTFLDNLKDKDRQLAAKQNNYLYAALLRKQKTIDFLLNL